MHLSKPLVRAKCRTILADVRRIEKMLKSFSYEELVTDDEKMTLAERYLERIVNRAIDVNYHMIRAASEPPPNDYTDSFIVLGKLKILPPKLSVAIAPSAGARNILVHEYDDLDTKLFYSSLRSCVRDYPKYLRAILSYIDSKK